MLDYMFYVHARMTIKRETETNKSEALMETLFDITGKMLSDIVLSEFNSN